MLVVEEVARTVAVDVIRLTRTVEPGLVDLANQARRAGTSVALNLAEGLGRTGRDRARHLRISMGSLREVQMAVHILHGVDALPAACAEQLLRQLDRLGGLLHGLLRR